MRQRSRARGLPRDEYIDERKELYKYQQAAYDGFERTITALSASFLAFSVAFLGFVTRPVGQNAVIGSVRRPGLLLASWLTFSASLVSLLLLFFANARGFTVEIEKIEDALHDDTALERSNIWVVVSKSLYGTSLFGFLSGLFFLLAFCWHNFAR